MCHLFNKNEIFIIFFLNYLINQLIDQNTQIIYIFGNKYMYL